MTADNAAGSKIYGHVATVGSLVLLVGCFVSIDAGTDTSVVDIFVAGLSRLSRATFLESGLEILLTFVLLLTAARSLLLARLGEFYKLKIAAVQAWVVLLIFYAQHFGMVLPLNMRADWGCSVLFLGATLLAFGAFRSPTGSVEETGKQTPAA